jgi:energy-coupling factor transport system permease protein
VGTIVYIAALFLVNGVLGYAFAVAALAALIVLSKVPAKFILKSVRGILFILIVTMFFNLLLTPGDILWQFGILRITRQGVVTALRMGLRLACLVTGSSIMTLTTTPNQLTDAMENLFTPLKLLHVPVHEISMMMSIALRFIPILMEETDKIQKAQIARGADFESGNLLKRVRGMIPLLVPLFVSAFRRANDLALAMEARCYHGGSGRTQMKPLRYQRRDLIAFLVMAVFLGICICFRIFGGGWI